MKTFGISSFAAILLSLMLVCTGCGNHKQQKDYMVIGYIAGYRDFDFSSIDAMALTHINYAFANIIDGRVLFGDEKIDNTRRKSEDITTLVALKEINPDLKVLVSVGGWTWSGNFSDAALNDSTRYRFAYSVAEFIRANDLDGIDLDWEYPNQPGAGNTYRAEDVHNFTLLLREVRKHIDSLAISEKRGEAYLLTIATGGDSVYVANTELGEVSRYCDFINIMSYDYHNGLTWQAGHHANLFLSDYDSKDGDAADRSVKMHITAGVPAEKINIGIPFYGRRWMGVDTAGHGLFRPAGTTGEAISYSSVLQAMKEDGYVRYYDSSASAPFLWRDKDSSFISYDDEISITAKMDYIRNSNLGGVMFWEYSEDVDGLLLKTINKELQRNN